jgi:hypothetical protein
VKNLKEAEILLKVALSTIKQTNKPNIKEHIVFIFLSGVTSHKVIDQSMISIFDFMKMFGGEAKPFGKSEFHFYKIK